MNTFSSSSDNFKFVLKYTSKCYRAYREYFDIHAVEVTDSGFDVLLSSVRTALAKRSEKLKVGGTYRVGVFSRNIGNETGCKTKAVAACLIVRVKMTGKTTAKIIDDTDSRDYLNYLVHIVRIPNGKTYPDFVHTDGVIARKAAILSVYGKNKPFYGNLAHINRMNDELDRLIKEMGEISL